MFIVYYLSLKLKVKAIIKYDKNFYIRIYLIPDLYFPKLFFSNKCRESKKGKDQRLPEFFLQNTPAEEVMSSDPERTPMLFPQDSWATFMGITDRKPPEAFESATQPTEQQEYLSVENRRKMSAEHSYVWVENWQLTCSPRLRRWHRESFLVWFSFKYFVSRKVIIIRFYG